MTAFSLVFLRPHSTFPLPTCIVTTMGLQVGAAARTRVVLLSAATTVLMAAYLDCEKLVVVHVCE